MKSIFVRITLLPFFIMCSNSKPEPISMDQVELSIKDLQRLYLDTAHTGITLDILFYDPLIEDRDSVKFYLVLCDEEFRHLEEIQGMEMNTYSDTLLRKVVRFSTDSMTLPVTFLYEYGAVYMSPPNDDKLSEWELDTVINEFFIFNVYDQFEQYQLAVDRFGLEPPVFIRE